VSTLAGCFTIMIDPTNETFRLLDGIALVADVAAVVVALCLALQTRRRRRKGIASGWLIVAIVITGMAMIDTGYGRPSFFDRSIFTVWDWHLQTLEAGMLILAPLVGMFALWQSRRSVLARWCIILAFLAGLMNAPTEAIEYRLVTNPQNYAFVAIDTPYRFESQPSRQLARVILIQEVSEDLFIVALLIGLIAIARQQP
jgi:hypothetical protein